MSGPQCCKNPPVLDPLSGSGHVEKVGGHNSYISGSSDSKLCVLLVSDIFGYEAPNIRAVADKVASYGFYVVVPDYFYGDPYTGDPSNPSSPERSLPVWIKDHGTDKGFEDTKPILEAIKNKGITSIGAAGMCWGAKVVVGLSKQKLIQAAVLLHPSFVTTDDIRGGKVPVAILGAENDVVSPPLVVKQFEEILASKPEVNSYVKIFPKVEHGWTVRYNIDDPVAVKAADEAHKDMLDWFRTYMK